MKNKIIIGIDLGGTKIAVASILCSGKIIKKKREITQISSGPSGIIKQMLRMTDEVISSSGITISQIIGIGIGAAGPLNIEKGVILSPPNLPNWDEVQLIKPFYQKFKIPVYLENDANAAALGELHFGAGKNCKNIIYLTISTGIGGGIIINGKLYWGSNYNAGEIGHTVISFDGPLCGCGNYGCLEAFASGVAIAKRTREYIIKKGPNTKILDKIQSLDEITSEIVFLSAKEGDEFANFILDESFNFLGIGISNICNIFNPEKVILGGGVTQVGDILFEKVRRVVRLRAFKPIAEKVEIVPAKLGMDVGVIGAGAVVLERLKIYER